MMRRPNKHSPVNRLVFIRSAVIYRAVEFNLLLLFNQQISALREAINQTANNELIQDFNKTEKFLIENGHVDNKVSYIVESVGTICRLCITVFVDTG